MSDQTKSTFRAGDPVPGDSFKNTITGDVVCVERVTRNFVFYFVCIGEEMRDEHASRPEYTELARETMRRNGVVFIPARGRE